MLVADTQQAATAATLGAQETTAMGMVDDAAFLLMLATNLYSNQNLACIRETLCNAWDAHIEAGTTHLPVKITITKDLELVIEDNGLGIPVDRFEGIYGVFGASTKRNNKAVTGGFGLGCKSPWAYTDSFRVISESQGKKTVYNLSRASVEAEGKPSITKVMELPTERSGLTVRIQLQQKDVAEMSNYIRAIARHGEMLIDFKDESRGSETQRLDRLGMATEVGSYSVEDDKWYYQYMGNHKLFVRYGAVLYPMLQTPGTKKAVDLLLEFMEMVGFSRMVVQAAPGTLALTPNREALSSQKMTEDGITELCIALVNRIEEDIVAKIPSSIREAIADLEKGVNESNLHQRVDPWQYVTPLPVRRYLQSQLGAAKKAKYSKEMRAAEHRGFKACHVFHSKSATKDYHKLRLRIEKQRTHAYGDYSLQNGFAQRHVMRPLAKVFVNNRKLLDFSKLRYSESPYGQRYSYLKRFVQDHMARKKFGELKQLVDKRVVFITSRLKDVELSINGCPSIQRNQSVWVYKIHNSDKEREAIIKAFQDGGFTVIDLTLNHSWDDVAQEALKSKQRQQASKPAAAPVVKQKSMLISIQDLYDAKGKRKFGTTFVKDVATTDTPLFFIEQHEYTTKGRVGPFVHYVDLTDEERKHGVIVRTGIERNMAIKRGAVEANKYFAQKFWDAINSEEYKRYVTQLRKPGVSTDHDIVSADLKLFDMLGIKLPGYEKLTFDPKMERLRAIVLDVSALQLHMYLNLTPGQRDHFSYVIEKYTLDELPFIKKLKAVHKDQLLRKLDGGSAGILDLIAENPERKSALKSLVLCALKTGPKK